MVSLRFNFRRAAFTALGCCGVLALPLARHVWSDELVTGKVALPSSPESSSASADTRIVKDYVIISPSLVRQNEPFSGLIGTRTDTGFAPLGSDSAVTLNGVSIPVQDGGKVNFPPITNTLGNVFQRFTIKFGDSGTAWTPSAVPLCHVEVLPVGMDVPIKIAHASDTITPGGLFHVIGQGLNKLTRVKLVNDDGGAVPISQVAGSSLEQVYLPRPGFNFSAGDYQFEGWDAGGMKYEAPNKCVRPHVTLDAPDVTHKGDRAQITVLSDHDGTVLLVGGEPRITLDTHLVPVRANVPAYVGYLANIVGMYEVIVPATPSIEELPIASDAPKADARFDGFQLMYDPMRDITTVTSPFHVVNQAGKPLANADCAGAVSYPGGVEYGRATSDGNGIAKFTTDLPGHFDDSLISSHMYRVYQHNWDDNKKPGTTMATGDKPGTTTASNPATPTNPTSPTGPASPTTPGTTTTTTTVTTTGAGKTGGKIDLPPYDFHLPTIKYTPDKPVAVTPPELPPINFNHTDDKTKPWLTYIGWFEPSQGVFQDDKIFPDKDTKQLTRKSPTSYVAELNMAVDRPTLLFGTRPSDHTEIMIKGISTYTIKVPVKHKFTLYPPMGSPVVIYEQRYATADIPIEGPAGPEQTFAVPLITINGVPTVDYVPPVFTFKNPGAYKIVDELVDEKERPTGISVDVSGQVVQTVGLKVAFIPALVITPDKDNGRTVIDTIKKKSDALADGCAGNIPFAYPIPPNSFTSVKQWVHDYTDPYPDELKRIDRRYTIWDSEVHEIDKSRQDRITGMLTRELGASANLSGVSRIICVVNKDDFNLLGGDGAVAFTQSEKVIFVRSNEGWDTVAHEIVHTTPYLWSGTQMIDEFGFSYHNGSDNYHADGVKIETNGERQRQRHKHAIMGNSSSDEWITQGTYWHLLPVFQKGLDPAMLLLSGYAKRHLEQGKPTKYKGILMPVYDMQGTLPLSPGPNGDWAYVLRDAAGKSLGRYPFPLYWAPSDGNYERNLMSFVNRVPALPGVAEVDLMGPGGLQDSIKISAHPPVVKIDEPGDGSTVSAVNGKVHVSWTGSDEDNDPLLYSVYYSPDGGQNWLLESFEQEGTTFDTPLETGAANPMVKVVVTDGGRSSEAVAAFTVK